jgi:hypothetical protein
VDEVHVLSVHVSVRELVANLEECQSMNHAVIRAARSPRALFRSCAAALTLMAMVAFTAPDAFAQQGRPTLGQTPTTFNVVPITITNVAVEGGQLIANGLVGTTPFQAPLTLTPEAVEGAACPILNLSLGPIDLSLLGLNVNTSRICLDITATPGGGLLGDLLCSIANLLQGGTPLADVLAGLSPQQLQRLTAGLTQILNQAVFIPLSSSQALQAASCEVLSLALGPVDLSLLGLNVSLDNCADGPVTLDITATPGGGLLGDLLCSLAENPLNNLTPPVLRLLQQIVGIIGGLLG